MAARNPSIQEIVLKLVKLSRETEWVEFKENNDHTTEIGRQISALANSAALHGKRRAFLVWGVHDKTKEIVGTTFGPRDASSNIGSQELENWLATQLNPAVHFVIHEVYMDGKKVVVFEIEPASSAPVAFKGDEWIRVGSYTKPLKTHPEKVRALWKLFNKESFETGIAVAGIAAREVEVLLNWKDFYYMAKKEPPPSFPAAAYTLSREGVVVTEDGNSYSITNLGALLFATDLERFPGIRRKSFRLIFYKGSNRIETYWEHQGRRGYASGFKGLMGHLGSHLIKKEKIGKALRTEELIYPEIALRELAANALIHQDFEITGAGPMLEVFPDRIEFTNPGTPLINVQRFLDYPPRSRNERLAHIMRRLRICEERGSGIDKVLDSVERFRLPPPEFLATGDHTRVILYAARNLNEMTRDEKIRACYQHAAFLQEVMHTQMTNESLRGRMGIAPQNYSTASRIIGDTLKIGLIKPFDPTITSNRLARYVPFWAH